MQWGLEITLVGAAYLLGSISSAILVCRMMHLPDPREGGSGNPGATNVLRLGGKKAAGITLLGDMFKGLLPVLLAQYVFHVEGLWLGLVGLAAFLGHLYPIFFGFKGGKGVATALGVLLGASWWVGLLTIVTWFLVAKLFKISSLAALVAIALSPLLLWLEFKNLELLGVSGVMVALLYWRHKANILRLMKGQEPKIGQKQVKAAPEANEG
jgi:glycerol-3-phosphate acyltransferase PlsY